MEWIIVITMGFFGFGVRCAIKLYYLNRDTAGCSGNLKLPCLGLAITFFIGGLLHQYAGMSAPMDNWLTWLILGGPFLLALFFGDESTLNTGRRE
jgi:hypothetical protein